MPLFDVFTINEKQLAMVRLVRSTNKQFTDTIPSSVRTVSYGKALNFNDWRAYIKRQIDKKKLMTTHSINHVFIEQKGVTKKLWWEI